MVEVFFSIEMLKIVIELFICFMFLMENLKIKIRNQILLLE